MACSSACCRHITSLSDDNFHRPVLKYCDCNYIIWWEISFFFPTSSKSQCVIMKFFRPPTWPSRPLTLHAFFYCSESAEAAAAGQVCECVFFFFISVYSEVKSEQTACSEFNLQIDCCTALMSLELSLTEFCWGVHVFILSSWSSSYTLHMVMYIVIIVKCSLQLLWLPGPVGW